MRCGLSSLNCRPFRAPGDLCPSLLLQSPEKAELEAAGDLGHLQGVRRSRERKRDLKKILGVQHQLGRITPVIQKSLRSEPRGGSQNGHSGSPLLGGQEPGKFNSSASSRELKPSEEKAVPGG